MLNTVFKNKWMAMMAVVGMFVFSSCDNDDPEPENETEVITRMEVKFTNNADATNVVFARFNDLDGPGGVEPTLTHPSLRPGATYTVTIELFNDLEGEDITKEILEEADEHQFFFIQTNSVFSTIEYLDQDKNGRPLGLRNRFVTRGTAGNGTLRIVLRHEPNKALPDVIAGNIANAGGDTDIDVTFNVTIQ
jgi:hypothetical protein